MEQTIVQIGNSAGVIFPTPILSKVGFKKGTKVFLEFGADQKSVIVGKANGKTSSSSVTPEFIRILEGVNKEYGPALAKLAQL